MGRAKRGGLGVGEDQSARCVASSDGFQIPLWKREAVPLILAGGRELVRHMDEVGLTRFERQSVDKLRRAVLEITPTDDLRDR